MGTYKTEALVLRAFDYGEADKIVTLFSRQHGKIRAIARGVAKPKSKKKGMVQPFVHARFLIAEGRTLDKIDQGEIITAFAGLREDLDKIACGSYLLELADGFITENARNESLYFLLLSALHMMESGVNLSLVLRLFEVRAMHYLGYSPALALCASCGVGAGGREQGDIFFSPSLGGIVCPACRGLAADAFKCSPGSLRLLSKLMEIDLRKVHVLRMSPPLSREVEKILREYIDFRLERKIKSMDFLQTITDV